MITYLSGCSNDLVIACAPYYNLGLLAQPNSGYRSIVDRYPVWAADNGCFSQGEKFRVERFYDWLEPLREHADTCLFAVAPDVLCDAEATTKRSLPVLPRIRELGFPAAYVGQNGLTSKTTPWGEFDVLFLGGDDEWKLGPQAAELTREAKHRGLFVHMGRVNSFKRLDYAESIGCDSADGTYLAFGCIKNLPNLLQWQNKLRDDVPRQLRAAV